MTKRTMIRVGSTVSVFILFGLIGGIFLNTLLTSAANSPMVAPVSTPSTDATSEPTTTPVADPTPSEAETLTPTLPPVVATPTPAPIPAAQGKLIVVTLATQSLTAYEHGKVVATTVGRLAVDLEATGARMTALVLVGDALRGAAARSHLYSPGYAHSYRRRSTAGTTTGRPA